MLCFFDIGRYVCQIIDNLIKDEEGLGLTDIAIEVHLGFQMGDSMFGGMLPLVDYVQTSSSHITIPMPYALSLLEVFG